MSSGQGKLPLDVVTDNALLRPKFEKSELGGKEPVMAAPLTDQGVITTIVKLTQSQYDALPTKDTATLYMVV